MSEIVNNLLPSNSMIIFVPVICGFVGIDSNILWSTSNMVHHSIFRLVRWVINDS